MALIGALFLALMEVLVNIHSAFGSQKYQALYFIHDPQACCLLYLSAVLAQGHQEATYAFVAKLATFCTTNTLKLKQFRSTENL